MSCREVELPGDASELVHFSSRRTNNLKNFSLQPSSNLYKTKRILVRKVVNPEEGGGVVRDETAIGIFLFQKNIEAFCEDDRTLFNQRQFYWELYIRTAIWAEDLVGGLYI
jgi:hypothetical protein